MATFAEIVGLVNQAEYEEGIQYYPHKEGLCLECGENMENVRMLTKSKFIPVVRYIIREGKP